MKYEKYDSLEVSSNLSEYKFVSTGPKGEIQQLIQFELTDMPGIYNLAFGSCKNDGSVDDLTITDNKDRNKILATIASAIYQFTMQFPEKLVFFTGSTPQRTRLYRMAIALNFDELVVDFQIFGILKEEHSFINVPFQKNIDYFGFMIRRKKHNFIL
jgi:hypothetical protein